MNTPKYSVGQYVLFKGQDYSLTGVKMKTAVVKTAQWNAEIHAVSYDLHIIADEEMASNCYEDMIEPMEE